MSGVNYDFLIDLCPALNSIGRFWVPPRGFVDENLVCSEGYLFSK